jgi:hypothetical protein
MTRIRRTKEQMEAGMSVEDVRSGITLDEFNKNKNDEPEYSVVAIKPNPNTTIRTRRNKVEIAAGMSVADLKSGMTLDQFIARKSKKQETAKKNQSKELATIVKQETSDEVKMKPTWLGGTTVTEKTKVVVVVKMITDKDEKGRTAQQIINEEFALCNWDYKVVEFASRKKKEQPRYLMNDGWRFMFLNDPKDRDPGSKKPVTLHFQKAILRK